MQAIDFTYYIRGLIGGLLLLAGCAAPASYTLQPVKWEDPDRQPISLPDNKSEHELWDRLDLTVIYQLQKPLNLNWTGRQLGQFIGITGPREADNVNVLGEVPNSSWFTNRHFHHRMTPQALAQGPNTSGGPDTSGPWQVVSGKLEGAAPGFVIADARGERYLLKFDGTQFPELASAAEVISTKLLYAAGYNVPQNYVVYFRPDRLTVDQKATIREKGVERPMTPEDVEHLLSYAPKHNGKVRAMASKYVDGQPVGVWEFRGTRSDDPNDRVWHEHRRELRGLRVIGSWINDADRRAANTLAVYTSDNYVKHYLIDMGSTLGANGASPHSPKHGYEYMFDPAEVFKSTVAAGLYERPWLFIKRDTAIRYPSVGYFEAELFDPGSWVPTYPNPAFQRMTLRDAYWGAKIVTSFRDKDIRAIVETAQLSNPAAEEHLIDLLIKRRDKIGQYWFSRINPLDHFRFEQDQPPQAVKLTFADLAVEGQLHPSHQSRYRYRILNGKGKPLTNYHWTNRPEIPLPYPLYPSFQPVSSKQGVMHRSEVLFQIQIQTKRAGEPLSKTVVVYGYFLSTHNLPHIVGIKRET